MDRTEDDSWGSNIGQDQCSLDDNQDRWRLDRLDRQTDTKGLVGWIQEDHSKGMDFIWESKAKG